MGFGIDIDGNRVSARVVCDTPGCGAEVDWAVSAFVAFTSDGSIRIACGTCRDRLPANPDARGIDLEDYIRSLVIGLDVQIEEDEDGDAPDPRHLAAVLADLESVAAAPGVPAGIGVRRAIEDGFIGAHHVARAWGAP